jgi:hypothetical protein
VRCVSSQAGTVGGGTLRGPSLRADRSAAAPRQVHGGSTGSTGAASFGQDGPGGRSGLVGERSCAPARCGPSCVTDLRTAPPGDDRCGTTGSARIRPAGERSAHATQRIRARRCVSPGDELGRAGDGGVVSGDARGTSVPEPQHECLWVRLNPPSLVFRRTGRGRRCLRPGVAAGRVRTASTHVVLCAPAARLTGATRSTRTAAGATARHPSAGRPRSSGIRGTCTATDAGRQRTDARTTASPISQRPDSAGLRTASDIRVARTTPRTRPHRAPGDDEERDGSWPSRTRRAQAARSQRTARGAERRAARPRPQGRPQGPALRAHVHHRGCAPLRRARVGAARRGPDELA